MASRASTSFPLSFPSPFSFPLAKRELGKGVSGKGKLAAEILLPQPSPSSVNCGRHVVIVMDALSEFSMEPLQWALANVIQSGCTVTLLGVMPYLPLVLALKTWLDVWMFDLGDLSALLKDRSEWRNDVKYQKIRGIIEICEEKGVVPCMRVAMGHPLKLMVLEQTTSLHATLVVLDRRLRKDKAFYAERIPTSVVMMNSAEEVDILKIQSEIDHSDTTTEESLSTLPPTPQVVYAEELMELLEA